MSPIHRIKHVLIASLFAIFVALGAALPAFAGCPEHNCGKGMDCKGGSRDSCR